MTYILLIISLLALSACGSDTNEQVAEITDPSDTIDSNGFALQNVRFDASDYYEGEQVTVTPGTSFEVQWVSPTSAAYKIDFYLSTNAEGYSENNQVVGLKCGNTSFSLCPNATGEVQCVIDDNKLSCSVGNESVGIKNFQETATLGFIIRACDGLGDCDVKAFDLIIESNTPNTNALL
ncbi:hypothetical protein [Colwellia echini]|uniref:Uncharacterized protein n=1 Tax=Colwellia echini TaxID=1982103 RepID=A0ABY3N0Q2_9GAMM|nr:hypothetical protein [Colwellia echini]TYK66989.1 hypothetical protein CWS31_000125 [Colwellia echini]